MRNFAVSMLFVAISWQSIQAEPPTETRVRVALALAGPQEVGVLDYAQAAALAKSAGKPLVTFRGMPSRPIEGSIVCSVTSDDQAFAMFPKKCIISSQWLGDSHRWTGTVDDSAGPVKAARRSFTGSGDHSHTCYRCGTSWTHDVHAGHDCPTCGTPQYVQDSAIVRPRPVMKISSYGPGCASG